MILRFFFGAIASPQSQNRCTLLLWDHPHNEPLSMRSVAWWSAPMAPSCGFPTDESRLVEGLLI